MAKTFKKFREDYMDDEWGDEDESVTNKERRMKNRRDRKKTKHNERNETFAEKNDLKRN
ncbi:MAG: hypothetical protein HOM88_05250 [Hellea sp.]|jgi:hypothetical protein|nr:hypothetical protein [Hellea sp.]